MNLIDHFERERQTKWSNYYFSWTVIHLNYYTKTNLISKIQIKEGKLNKFTLSLSQIDQILLIHSQEQQMEVLYHTHNGLYPFHRHTNSESAFVEHLVTVSNSNHYERLKELTKIYRSLTCPHLIRLHKILRDDNQIHFLYEYHQSSLEAYADNKPSSQIKRIETEVGNTLKQLQNAGIKAEIKIQNLGVDEQGSLKLFILPQTLEPVTKEELQDFYSTEKTRIKLQIEQIWQRQQNLKEEGEVKQEKNPGFIISGNELIFIKKDKNQKGQGPTSSTSTAPPASASHEAAEKQQKKPYVKNIIEEIQRQRELTQKLRSKKSNVKIQNQTESGEKISGKSQISKNKDIVSNIKQKLSKTNSMDSDQRVKSQQEQNVEFGNIFQNANNERMVSSAAATMKASDSEMNKIDDRPISSIKSEKRSSYCPNQISEEDLRKIARKHLDSEGPEQEAKIHVTTEMVSKYKMKIVTCQEIEFQGKEGDDIEKLAHEKLLQYQAQHGYPQIIMEPTCEELPAKVEENEKEKNQSGKEHRQSGQLWEKILKAKEKANSALKEHAKGKKK